MTVKRQGIHHRGHGAYGDKNTEKSKANEQEGAEITEVNKECFATLLPLFPPVQIRFLPSVFLCVLRVLCGES